MAVGEIQRRLRQRFLRYSLRERAPLRRSTVLSFASERPPGAKLGP